jgi:hypothetical protein
MFDWNWVGTIQPRRNGSKKFLLKIGTKKEASQGVLDNQWDSSLENPLSQ